MLCLQIYRDAIVMNYFEIYSSEQQQKAQLLDRTLLPFYFYKFAVPVTCQCSTLRRLSLSIWPVRLPQVPTSFTLTGLSYSISDIPSLIIVFISNQI